MKGVHLRRPILIAMIGYIIGILVGLYSKRDKIEEENDIKSRKNKKVKENKTRKK